MKKIAFISHSFYPEMNVGSFRLSYWAKNIQSHDKSLTPTVFTASEQAAQHCNFANYVPTNNSSVFPQILKDAGLRWRAGLRRELSKSEFDWYIFSGNPFLHFSIASKLKKKFNCKILMDFRDPFAYNPSFSGQSFGKDKIRAILQKNFLKSADVITTVNKNCAEIIAKSCPKKLIGQIQIIENGFDDTVMPNNFEDMQECLGTLKLAYTGKFLKYRNPNNLFSVLGKDGIKNTISFHYVGQSDFAISNTCFNYGSRSYQEAVNLISSCDIGVVFTGSSEFESTTKVYDYIGLNKPILVITDGIPKRGAIGEILLNYPKTFWCKNSEADIEKCLKEIIKSDLTMSFDNKNFSREKGLNQLVKILNH